MQISKNTEHPFAPFIRILGKGKTGTRSLSFAEARDAFSMILKGEVEQSQVGAFLMLLRVKEETGEELAGFVKACRDYFSPVPAALQADLDWSSYAGKKHQHPWFILSILLLSQAGYRIFVHGADGHTPQRLYTESAFSSLGLPIAHDWNEAAGQLDKTGLSYMPLRDLCAPLNDLIDLRALLGLRSPVHTLTRMLNPLTAPASIQSVFHPAYGKLHQEADLLLGQTKSLVFKGESGEVEIKPQADTRLQILRMGQFEEEIIGRSIPRRVEAVGKPSAEPLRELWHGTKEDGYGLSALLATAAVALALLGRGSFDECLIYAEKLWFDRDKARLS